MELSHLFIDSLSLKGVSLLGDIFILWVYCQIYEGKFNFKPCNSGAIKGHLEPSNGQYTSTN